MRQRSRPFFSSFLPAVFLVLFLGIWFCRWNQWDTFTAITVIPFWMYAIPCGIIVRAAAWIGRSRFGLGVCLLWAGAALGATGEVRSLIRSLEHLAAEREGARGDRGFRIVSLKAGDTLPDGAQLRRLGPDIVLIQQLTSEDAVIELTVDTFESGGSFVRGERGAILGKGRFLTFAEDEETGSIHTRFNSAAGVLFDLTGVQLEESLPDGRLWRGDTWNRMRDKRREKRRAVRRFVESYGIDANQPVRIVGGDFGAPPGDDIYRPLRTAGLRDLFRLAGRGFGNTEPAGLPLYRSSQIWASPELVPHDCHVRQLEGWDGRVLICDFVIGRPDAD